MSSSEPIAYTYEVDTHCPYHARLRFGRDARGIIGGESVDREGNAVGAVYEWDDWSEDGLYCGDDLETIRAPYICACGHGPNDHDIAGNESWLCGVCSCVGDELAPFTLTDTETIARVLRP